MSSGILCVICEGDNHNETSRVCEIGIICKDCYPQYKKTRDALKEYYNEILKRRLGAIKL